MVEKVVKFRRIHLQLFEAVDQISESMNEFVVLPQRCGQASADSSLIDLEHDEDECQSAEQNQKRGNRKVENDEKSPAKKYQRRKSAYESAGRPGNGHGMRRDEIIGRRSSDMLDRSQVRVPNFVYDTYANSLHDLLYDHCHVSHQSAFAQPESKKSESHYDELPKVGFTLNCFTCSDRQSENDKHVQHPGDDAEDQETPVESF